jgi:outer membrane protein TolC
MKRSWPWVVKAGSFVQMIRTIRMSIALCLAACGLILASTLAGCGLDPQKVKSELDEDVYNVIDKKWDEKFGIKANYKVSDVEPSPDDIVIEQLIPESGILTIPQAVALATAHNRLYQAEKEAMYVLALDREYLRHLYVPNFFALGAFETDEDLIGDEMVSGEVAFGFRQLLAGGGMLTTQVALGWLDILTGDVRSGMTSILSATVELPLLRGHGRLVALEQLTQADRNVLYQIRTFNRFRQTLVVDVISQYYNVLELHNVMTNAEANYRVVSRFYERIAALTEAGKLAKHELEQAYQDRLEALDGYILAKNEYEEFLDLFKITLGVPTTTNFTLDPNELTALVARGVPKIDFSEDDAVDTALQVRLDLANLADMVLDAERQVKVAEDGLRPQLDLIAGFQPKISNKPYSGGIISQRQNTQNVGGAAGGVGGTGGTTTTPVPPQNVVIGPGQVQYVGATPGQTREAEHRYQLSLQLDLPLDRMAEKVAYRKALLYLIQQRRAHEEATDLVVLGVRLAYRKLKAARDRYLVQSQGEALARKRVEDTFALLEYSSPLMQRASVRDVLDAQKDLLNAQTEAAEALVDYNTALLEFYRDVGVLQVKPDGMWQTAFPQKSLTKK